MKMLGSAVRRRRGSPAILAAAVALACGAWVALPAAADTTYTFCGLVLHYQENCAGARHTLYYIDVYRVGGTSSVTLAEFAETSQGNGNPLHEKFGVNDVNSGSDFNGNSSLLYPYGWNKSPNSSPVVDAYDLVH